MALICMIVLALPVQGIAAATMRFCTPDHHSKAAHARGAQTPHRHGGHAPVAAASHHHHDEQSVADAANGEPSGAPVTTSRMKCSVCAVCCMAAALAPATPTVPALEAVSRITLPAVASYVGPVADGLERPPRPLLA
jgi:hypothetical protein